MSFLSDLVNASLATHVLSGNRSGYDYDWMNIPKTKLYTNVFIVDEKEGKVRHRRHAMPVRGRGFGKELYNGFGGKVEPGETIAKAALRELEEEAGIRANILHCGTLLFFAEGDSYAHLVEVFRATTPISGDPTEYVIISKESSIFLLTLVTWPVFDKEVKRCGLPEAAAAMTNNDLPSIPFDRMWADVPLWFPLMLSNQRFIGRVDFAKFTDEPRNAEMVKWWIGTIAPSGSDEPDRTRSTFESV